MFTTTKHPTMVDLNTCLLYCSTTDSHFTIDSIDYTTMYTGIVGKPMQPVNYANFSMKEPYGCFFVEKIERAMKILQTSAWASARFYLKIDFVGTKAGGVIDIIPGVWFHFIPSGNMGVTVNSMAGAEYTMQAVITDYCYSDDEHTCSPTSDSLTVKGDKVQSMLNDLQDKLNRAYDVAYKRGGGNKKVIYVFDAGEFGSFDINVNSAEQVKNAGRGETQKDYGDNRNIGQMLIIKPGESISSFINDKILMNTIQYTQMLSENKTKVTRLDQTGLDVAKIVYSSELTDDSLIVKYKIVKVTGQNFSTIIEKEKMATVSRTASDIAAAKEYQTGEFTPDKNYAFDFHYTFGTENTEVENFEMRAENIMAYITGDNIGTTDNSLNHSSKYEERFKPNVFNESINQFETATKNVYIQDKRAKDVVVQQKGGNIITHSASNNDAEFAAKQKEAKLALLRYSATPGLALQATIRGHLGLLRIDKYLKEKEKNEGDNTYILAKFEVRNIDGEQFWNNGYYLVNAITNRFQGGKFRQNLVGFYISDQEKTE